jgi:hypothetical protein
VALANARTAAVEAQLARPSSRPVVAYALGVVGTVAALTGAYLAARGGFTTVAAVLAAGGAGLSGAGLVIAVWN